MVLKWLSWWAPKELQESRKDICKQCDRAENKASAQRIRCGECGCNINLKVKAKAGKCPIGKW